MICEDGSIGRIPCSVKYILLLVLEADIILRLFFIAANLHSQVHWLVKPLSNILLIEKTFSFQDFLLVILIIHQKKVLLQKVCLFLSFSICMMKLAYANNIRIWTSFFCGYIWAQVEWCVCLYIFYLFLSMHLLLNYLTFSNKVYFYFVHPP